MAPTRFQDWSVGKGGGVDKMHGTVKHVAIQMCRLLDRLDKSMIATWKILKGSLQMSEFAKRAHFED